MDKKKLLTNADVASIATLKAELYRKQDEAKHNNFKDFYSEKKTSLTAQKKFYDRLIDTVQKAEKKKKDSICNKTVEEEDQEFLEKLELAKTRLEAKTLLYDKLQQGKVDMDKQQIDSIFLVDFQKKSMQEVYNTTSVQNYSDNLQYENFSTLENLSLPDEEWVEYTDALGRTRCCLRKDLLWMQTKDSISNQQKSVPIEKTDVEKKEINDFVHYQNVLKDEIWSHGVGYYSFSTKEEERQKQQQLLQNLRQQTEKQKKKSQELQKLRKKKLQDRLSKVREKKSDKYLDVDSDNEVEEELSSSTQPIQEENFEKEFNPLTEQTIKQHIRPWDLGKLGLLVPHSLKRKKLTQEEWNEKCRSERYEQFAPPKKYSFKDDYKVTSKNKLYFKKFKHFHYQESGNELNDKDMKTKHCKSFENKNPEFAPPAFYYKESNLLNSHNSNTIAEAVSVGLKLLRQQSETNS